MLQLKCTGLVLTPVNALDCAEGSIDVQVQIEFDNTYADYTKVLHIGYYDERGAERGAKASLENDVFKIPGPVFAQSGIIFLSVHFSKTGESSEPETKPVYYQVQKTAGGVGSLPASYIWEPVVKRYVQEVIDNGDITFSTDQTLSKPGQAADAKTTGDAINKLAKDKTNQANTLWAILQKVRFFEAVTEEELNTFKNAWGITENGGEDEPIIPDEPDIPTEPTLTSITATYNGGSVLVGTELTDLVGNIVVTAKYSDDTSKNVTGYELSGSIVEGVNTITVSFEGKTTTFTVNGVAVSTDMMIEYYFNGADKWDNGGNSVTTHSAYEQAGFMNNIVDFPTKNTELATIESNDLEVVTEASKRTQQKDCIAGFNNGSTNYLSIKLSVDKVPLSNVGALRTYLQENPIKCKFKACDGINILEVPTSGWVKNIVNEANNLYYYTMQIDETIATAISNATSKSTSIGALFKGSSAYGSYLEIELSGSQLLLRLPNTKSLTHTDTLADEYLSQFGDKFYIYYV